MSAPTRKEVVAAGVYSYSRIVASLMVLLTLKLATEFYSLPLNAAFVANHAVFGPVAKFFSSEENLVFGFLAAYLLLYETASTLGAIGLPEAVFYFIGRDGSAAPRVVRQTTLLLLLTALPVIAIVVGVGLLQKPELGIVHALPWLAISLLFELPTQPAVNQLIVSGKAGLASLLHVLFSLFRPLALCTTYYLGLDVVWMPALVAGLSALRLFAHLAIVKRYFAHPTDRPANPTWHSAQLREILWFAIPIAAASIAGKLNPQIDKYVVGWLRSVDDFNAYSVAWEVPLITLIPYAIAAVMQGRYAGLFARREFEQLGALWISTIRKTAVAVVPLTIFAIVFARELMILVAGQEFERSTILFQIFTAVILHRVASYGSLLQAIGRTRVLYITSSALLLTNLLLSLPFVHWFGFIGPALASAVSVIPPWLITLRVIRSDLQLSWRQVFPWEVWLATIAISLAVGVAVRVGIGYVPVGPGLRVLVALPSFVVMFVVAARIARLLTSHDVKFFGEWLSLRILREK